MEDGPRNERKWTRDNDGKLAQGYKILGKITVPVWNEKAQYMTHFDPRLTKYSKATAYITSSVLIPLLQPLQRQGMKLVSLIQRTEKGASHR